MVVKSHLAAALGNLLDLLTVHGSERDFTQSQYDRIMSVANEIKPFELIRKRIAESKGEKVEPFIPEDFAHFVDSGYRSVPVVEHHVESPFPFSHGTLAGRTVFQRALTLTADDRLHFEVRDGRNFVSVIGSDGKVKDFCSYKIEE